MDNQIKDWRIELQNWLQNNPKTMPDDLRQLREEFVQRFPIERLADLTLEEYAIGKGNSDSFCYWLEVKTRELGSIKGGNVSKFGIWWSKKEVNWSWNSALGSDSPEEAFQKLKDGLLKLIQAVQANQFDKLDEIGLQGLGSQRNSLRAKPLYLYFPENFLPISNPTHLKNFLNYFSQQPQEGLHSPNRQLLKFLQSQPELEEFDTRQMMCFLYHLLSQGGERSLMTNSESAEELMEDIEVELEQLVKIAKRTRNIILYGPPGTGKTYWLRRFAEFFLAKQLQVPISPEQRRQEILQGLSWYEVIALTLYLDRQKKQFFRASELGDDPLINEYWKLTATKKLDNMIQAMLQSHTDPSVKTVLYANRHSPFLFEKNNQKQWWLTKAGQEYVEENLSEQLQEIQNPKATAPDLSKYLKIVTFHQSFAYEEFIEGLKPITDEEGQVRYEVVDGVFKSICKQAELDPEHRYLLIIDEINRANIAKVIGELITLIEDDKRLGERNELMLTLPYSGQKFGVPSNLYILGTMNTADRSIALLDIAIRRRFAFVELMPNPNLLNDKDIDGVQLDKLLAQLNHRIVALLSHDYQIGHSYFLDVNDIEDLHFTWYHRVIPLLQEYFYNDGQRLQALIGEDFLQPVEIDSATQKALKDLYDPDLKYEIKQLEGERFLDALRKLAE
jgi:5-methylcytosine-specific restriction protein B